MMRIVMGWSTSIALVALLAATPAAAQDDFVWSQDMERGSTLRVQGITGEIRAVAASGARAEVRGVKHGRRGDFEEVRILVQEDRNGFTVCAVYGQRDPVHCNQGDGDRDGRGSRRSIDVRVDFEVLVPEGVMFEGIMVTGDIEARDLRSNVEISTVTGDIFVSTSEVAEARTVTGRIEVEMGSTDFKDLEFATVSGNITVFLPSSINADIDFQSLMGDFESDFDLSIHSQKRRFIGSEFSGRLGSGGPELSFQTVTGDVELRRLRGN